MKTSTLFTSQQLSELELAGILEQQFNATWFPEYHRCSIDTDGATVYVDFDSEYDSQLAPDEQSVLAENLGFRPKAALHISSSTYHNGSVQLAELVFQTLCRQLDGRTLVAA